MATKNDKELSKNVEGSNQGKQRLTRLEHFTIATLTLVNVFNYMDRYSVAGVLIGIQATFNITDELGGLLQSAFIVAYMFLSPLFGFLGDRYSRRWILFASIILWTLMTIAASFAPKYWVFLVLRMLVGVGEAGFSTVAPTVLSDIVSKDARTIVLAIFYLALPVGSGIGYVVGAQIEQWMGSWRWGLRLTPILGILGSIAVIFIVDPKRGEKEAAALGGEAAGTTSYKKDLIYLFRNKSFLLSTFAFTCVSFIAGALSWWAPKCLFYGFQEGIDNNITLANVNFYFGALTVLTGVVGVVLGAVLSKCLRRRFKWIDPVICGAGLIISLPFLIGALFTCVVSNIATYVLIFFGQITLNLNWPIVADILLYVVMPTRRSSGAAVQMLISHALGDCISPFFVGVLSEHFKGWYQLSQYNALKMSFFAAFIFQLLGGILFFINAFFVVRDKEKADKDSVL